MALAPYIQAWEKMVTQSFTDFAIDMFMKTKVGTYQ